MKASTLAAATFAAGLAHLPSHAPHKHPAHPIRAASPPPGHIGGGKRRRRRERGRRKALARRREAA